jgi:hypothetical protein
MFVSGANLALGWNLVARTVLYLFLLPDQVSAAHLRWKPRRVSCWNTVSQTQHTKPTINAADQV